MKILRLEAIGLDVSGASAAWGIERPMPWVARLRYDGDRVYRDFLRPRRDYSQANRKGTRGVMFHFELYDGVYEVLELLSWRSERQYFVAVEGNVCVEINRDEAIEALEALNERA